jgi:DNA polymerase type B, organellar and viral
VSEAFKQEKYSLEPVNLGGLDIETHGFKDGYITGMARHWDGTYFIAETPKSLLEFCLDTPLDSKRRHTSGWMIAHNGGGFDFAYLAEAFFEVSAGNPDMKISMISQGQKFIGAVVRIQQGKRKYTVTFIDSLAICPSSLAKMTQAFAPHMPKSDHCPDHDFTSGGPDFDPECPVCMAYLKMDVDSMIEAIRGLETVLHEKFGVPISITAGSIAVKAAKAMLPDGAAYFRLHSDKEDFCRNAVHGGFVWAGHERGNRGAARTYDMSGAYAARLRDGVPYGHPAWTTVYDDEIPGIWDVTVSVPHDIEIPLIAAIDGGYPTGTFRTTTTSIEIAEARKSGCEVITVHSGIVFDAIEYPFDDFVKVCEDLEYPQDGSSPDPAVKNIVKLLRNALPGKFASKGKANKYFMPEDPALGSVPLIGPDGQETGVWYFEETMEGNAYIHPEWNAWITANQRILIRRALLAGGKKSYYSDTDSITLDPVTADELEASGILKTGIGYGKYHGEGDWDEFVVAAPKLKMGLSNGHWHTTSKGIPKRLADQAPELITAASKGVAEEYITWDSPLSFRYRLTHPGSALGVTRRRRFSLLEHSANWTVLGNMIRPRSVSEARIAA